MNKPAGHRKCPLTITAETTARHDEKTSAGRAEMLSGGDTEEEVSEVLGCLVVQTVNTMISFNVVDRCHFSSVLMY